MKGEHEEKEEEERQREIIALQKTCGMSQCEYCVGKEQLSKELLYKIFFIKNNVIKMYNGSWERQVWPSGNKCTK